MLHTAVIYFVGNAGLKQIEECCVGQEVYENNRFSTQTTLDFNSMGKVEQVENLITHN